MKRGDEGQGEDGQAPGKDRALEKIPPSQPLAGTNPVDTLVLDFLPPEPRDKKFLLFEPSPIQSAILCFSIQETNTVA